MTAAITIDTLEALQAAHKLYDAAGKVHKIDQAKAQEMTRVADAGFSALVPYLKDRDAPVMRKHYDAMQKMIDYAKDMSDAPDTPS